MNRRICGLLLALSMSASTFAQAPRVATSPAAGASVLRAGTAVPIRLLKELTTEGKHLRPGDRFDIEVAEPVAMSGQTVIPVGSHGVGEVTSIRNKGMWGKSGDIEARLLYVRVGDRQIRITGTFNDKGVTGTAGVVGALVVIPVAGFFVTGTSARIPSGAQVTAYLDEDIPVLFANGAPAASAPLIAQPAVSTAPAPTPPAVAINTGATVPAVAPVTQPK